MQAPDSTSANPIFDGNSKAESQSRKKVKTAVVVKEAVRSNVVEAEKFTAGELEKGTENWVRVSYKCPLCFKNHFELICGKGPTPDSVEATCKNGFGTVIVRPYRHSE